MAKYIPEQHYVTWRNFAEEFPLAFMTVYGTDAAAKKRMATADSWVSSHRGGVLPVKNIWDNEPLTGISIGEEVRRWSTSNVVWRVNDPRGFQLEISSGNMAYLLGNCDIIKGVIQEELMWVRDGADNYLLPTASEEFKTYQRNSKAKASNTKIKDLTVGDRISLLTGESGTYLGMYSCVRLGSGYGDGSIIGVKRYHIVRDESHGDEIRYVAKASWKGISIDKAGAEENKDYSDEINENIADLYSPNRADYVCKDKFNVKEVLQTMDIIPYVPDNKPNAWNRYFVEYKDRLHQASFYTHRQDGTLVPYTVDSQENKVDSDYGNQITVTDSEGNSMWGGRNKSIKLAEVKDLEKFVYAVVIDGEVRTLEL